MRYTLTTTNYKSIARNALIFSAPAILLILTSLQAGKSWADIQGIVYLWLLNTLTDTIRKFIAKN